MPTYEFFCKKCEKKFSLTISLKEREEKKLRCPKCSSTRLEQQFSAFTTKTSKKS
jgi:putative FmdB family regulatory protein